MAKETFDLSWGDPACVRQSLIANLAPNTLYRHDYMDLSKMSYTPHYGNEQLIELTRDIIERQTGHRYEHVVLTNGATGGITIAMRSFQKRTFGTVLTNPGPYFPIYPTMIEAAGMKHGILTSKYEWDIEKEDDIFLLDSPSNPLGSVNRGLANLPIYSPYIIWDAVYHNKVYAPKTASPVDHANVTVGSYSKLLGLSGARIGWIATDSDFTYERIKTLVDGEYCGLSKPSMDMLVHVLPQIDWDRFEKKAQNALNDNRTEWQKVTKFFENQDVNPIGMFYYAPVDKVAQKLLTKSNVIFVPGNACGDSDKYGRFNLGQETVIVSDAVRTILKSDSRK